MRARVGKNGLGRMRSFTSPRRRLSPTFQEPRGTARRRGTAAGRAAAAPSATGRAPSFAHLYAFSSLEASGASLDLPSFLSFTASPLHPGAQPRRPTRQSPQSRQRRRGRWQGRAGGGGGEAPICRLLPHPQRARLRAGRPAERRRGHGRGRIAAAGIEGSCHLRLNAGLLPRSRPPHHHSLLQLGRAAPPAHRARQLRRKHQALQRGSGGGGAEGGWLAGHARVLGWAGDSWQARQLRRGHRPVGGSMPGEQGRQA